MTPRKSHHNSNEMQDDHRLSRMIALSAVLHMMLITGLIISTTRYRADSALPTTYTVALVDPAALGTNLPGGGEAKESPAAKKEEPKVAQPPQPKKEGVKLPEKEKPPVKLETAKAKVEEKKPETKKSEPPQVTTKETPKPEVKPEQQTQAKSEEKTPLPTKTETPALSPDERDKQIHAALERVRAKVDKGQTESGGPEDSPRSPTISPGPGIKGSGPPTLGGSPGEGGGGLVRGLDYILYTEQVKRRVKEGWIVAERKSGLTATVRFSVQSDGEVSGIELMKPSGDRTFDESVLRAVNKANPLPPPPQAYQQEFATQKVEVIFRSEERAN